MKEKYPVEISCPKCGAAITFDMWTHVDSDLNVEETYEITSGTFFRHVCPCCGKGINIYHSLGFIDPRTGTIINYIQTDETAEEKAERARNINEFFASEDSNIKSEVVFTPEEFIDHVRRVRFSYTQLPESRLAAI